MRLAFFLSLFICPKDTARCCEVSSQHDVIEVVISGEIQKPRQMFLRHLPGSGWVISCQLEIIEILGAPDGGPAVVDPQFGENVFGVGAKGVNRHAQL